MSFDRVGPSVSLVLKRRENKVPTGEGDGGPKSEVGRTY